MPADVVSLEAERQRRDPARKVGLYARDGRVFISFADGKTVWLTPAKARLWATALNTLADTAEVEDPRG